MMPQGYWCSRRATRDRVHAGRRVTRGRGYITTAAPPVKPKGIKEPSLHPDGFTVHTSVQGTAAKASFTSADDPQTQLHLQPDTPTTANRTPKMATQRSK